MLDFLAYLLPHVIAVIGMGVIIAAIVAFTYITESNK